MPEAVVELNPVFPVIALEPVDPLFDVRDGPFASEQAHGRESCGFHQGHDLVRMGEMCVGEQAGDTVDARFQELLGIVPVAGEPCRIVPGCPAELGETGDKGREQWAPGLRMRRAS